MRLLKIGAFSKEWELNISTQFYNLDKRRKKQMFNTATVINHSLDHLNIKIDISREMCIKFI